jgi:hypothetical protein
MGKQQRVDVVEVPPRVLRLLERLARGRAVDGVVPSVPAVIASLAESAAASERERPCK